MREVSDPILEAEMALSDGRTLAYALWGDPDGDTVLLFHGAPGSRFFAPDPGVTAEAGVCLVTVDRPGYGRSAPDPIRQILDWPNDILQLAVTLQATQFSIVAHSSGGPYALACAVRMPERVSGIALVSCVAPYELDSPGLDDEDRALTRLARHDPDRAAAEFAGNATWLALHPERFLDLPRPDPDAQLMNDNAIRNMFLKAVSEAVRQGIDAYARECVLERRPWGFALADVPAEVSIWQGERDETLPPEQAVHLHSGLSHSTYRLDPDAGHGLILRRWAEILSDVTA